MQTNTLSHAALRLAVAGATSALLLTAAPAFAQTTGAYTTTDTSGASTTSTTTNPGTPNTGAGGDAAGAGITLVAALGAAGAGAWMLSRRRSA